MELEEITLSIPVELKKRIGELQEELEMDSSEIFKEALKYYIDLMDIDEALANDPLVEEEKDESSFDVDDYDLPPLIEEEDFSDYPDYG